MEQLSQPPAPKAPVKKNLAVLLAAGCLTMAVWPAQAQYNGGTGSTTLRNPLIQGALTTPANTSPQPGLPPAVGSGMTPPPVTPGMTGTPLPPPSAVSVPAAGAMDKSTVNQAVAPYLTPPPSTPGADPGELAGLNGYIPPAADVNIQPQGGISGQAPITKWGGQATRDLGLNRNSGSLTTDFGQNISNLPSVVQRGITRSVSYDGPRPASYPGQMDSTSNRQPSRTGAQTCQDLHGNRCLFKGANLRAQMTIVPF